ncbi:MAG TPA: isocitrate/isopropylmalate family dehydrogenase, partial [Anaerolineaceae bacterium]|nr:isocitrate/isopropylmalate family dehydrogenase [Anaerolineaceae bacterium]
MEKQTNSLVGHPIRFEHSQLVVPADPIIPFIEGDGSGPDIWRAACRVMDAAVEKAYHGERRIAWKEVYAGKKAADRTNEWLPTETIQSFKDYLVGIKGPLMTPVGGGMRSLNVALRKALDLYVCMRPVRWFEGVPSPVCHPESMNMVIFRENTEDLYAGIEFESGSPEYRRFSEILRAEFP